MAASDHKHFINFLLIGETGVGKSTFVNAFINYMLFNELQDAEEAEELLCLVPTRFNLTLTDDNYDDLQEVSIGHDENESTEIGKSATQATKSYTFSLGFRNKWIRLIDTPGIGDHRGTEQDKKNFENILCYVSQFDEIHGICILLKPHNARLTVFFEYCIKQLLTRLEKSAHRNIVFIFTNARASFYRPGDTLQVLKKTLNKIKSEPARVEIPLTRDNVFYVDNEAFQYLVSIKNGRTFTELEKNTYTISWDKSARACWKLVNYVSGDADKLPLIPHEVKNTISVNWARCTIAELCQPLADISQLIIDNLHVLSQHKKHIKSNEDALKELSEKLLIPVIDLEITETSVPHIVCTSASCCKVSKVGGFHRYHYSTVCHSPCYLKINHWKGLIGSPELESCVIFDPETKKCKMCSCSYTTHMYTYYQTKEVKNHVTDENVSSEIAQKRNINDRWTSLLENIQQRIYKYEKEVKIISETAAKFVYFLQNNAIVAYDDGFEKYLEYLIIRELSMGNYSDKDMIHHLQNLLEYYKNEKSKLDETAQVYMNQNNLESYCSVAAQDVLNSLQKLYNLEYVGQKIQHLCKQQRDSQSNEQTNVEYVHPTSVPNLL